MNSISRVPGVLGLLIFVFAGSIFLPISSVQETRPLRDPIVIQVIHLDYADAEYLSSMLAPLLSKDGKVVAYRPTNSIIIKDRESLIKRLADIVKGSLHHPAETADILH